MVHADITYCVTHTRTFPCSSDHSVPVGYRSPGRTPHFQYPSCRLPSTFHLEHIQGSSHLLLRIRSITLLTAPLWLLPPNAHVHTQWQIRSDAGVAGRAYGDGRSGRSALSRSMMERLASLWRSSSCFTICLMRCSPLERNQHSTGEQIAVKAKHRLCHLLTWLFTEPLIHENTAPTALFSFQVSHRYLKKP